MHSGIKEGIIKDTIPKCYNDRGILVNIMESDKLSVCLGRMDITPVPSFPFQQDNHSVPAAKNNLYPFPFMKKLNTT